MFSSIVLVGDDKYAVEMWSRAFDVDGGVEFAAASFEDDDIVQGE